MSGVANKFRNDQQNQELTTQLGINTKNQELIAKLGMNSKIRNNQQDEK